MFLVFFCKFKGALLELRDRHFRFFPLSRKYPATYFIRRMTDCRGGLSLGAISPQSGLLRKISNPHNSKPEVEIDIVQKLISSARRPLKRGP